VILGQEPFLEFVSEFMKSYPRIKIDLFVTNLYLDLIEENIDVGIRFGALKDSTLIAKKLGAQVRYVVAAPAYLKGHKFPAKPGDLRFHQCVLLSEKNNEAEWELVSGRKHAKVHVSGPISSRDFQSIGTFVYRGHGIGFLPSTYCNEKIKKGELIRLLPEWVSPRFDVHAVYPTRKFLPSRLHVFLEALKTWKSPLWTLP
jgi:DNA-binding transcriptional LysR family regulator